MEDKHTPAFPSDGFERDNTIIKNEGLTKREYAAIKITAALVAKYSLNGPSDQDVICKMAVELTDTLFKELEP